VYATLFPRTSRPRSAGPNETAVRGAADPREDRLPAPEPGSIRSTAGLRRRVARRDRVGARAAQLVLPGPRAQAPRDRRGLARARSRRWVGADPRHDGAARRRTARPTYRFSRAKRSASAPAIA
jgi:hypothetical protein